MKKCNLEKGGEIFKEEEMASWVGAIGDVSEFADVSMKGWTFMNSSLSREANKHSTGVMDGENLRVAGQILLITSTYF